MSSFASVLEEHRGYLADTVRLDAFAGAIQEIVKLGHVVMDLGAGTGILGALACRAGARRVYAVDASPMLELAKKISKCNGLDSIIVHIKGMSTEVDLPERVDVVVADQIGWIGINGGILQYFSDARERLLKPHGNLIPSHITSIVAPIESPRLWEEVNFWSSNPCGLNFSSVRSLAVNNQFACILDPSEVLGDPVELVSVELMSAAAVPFSIKGSATVSRSGLLHGLGGWFSARLSPSYAITNSPLSKERIKRNNLFFPIDKPVEVKEGDQVAVVFNLLPAAETISWSMNIFDDCGLLKARFRQNVLEAMPLSPESLRLLRPDYTPALTAIGRARLCVLMLNDGNRSISEIENEISLRHSAAFVSQRDVTAFVAQIVTRNSH